MSGWCVDHEALRALAAELGITKPVSGVKRRFPHSYIHGAQQSGEDGHVVMVNREISADLANATLCHELRHCLQREQLGADADMAYTVMNMVFGYDDNPLEKDADEYMAATAPHVRLIREA
jgi:hypothetical protein